MAALDPTNLTAHGLKSTTLAMMARLGLSPTTRLILGHHSMKGLSSLEVYSRDAQPLREYEGMMEAIRGGTYVPDATRSGLMVASSTLESASAAATSLVEGQGPGVSFLRRSAEQKDRASTAGDMVDAEPVGDSEVSSEMSSSTSDSSTDDEPIKNFLC